MRIIRALLSHLFSFEENVRKSTGWELRVGSRELRDLRTGKFYVWVSNKEREEGGGRERQASSPRWSDGPDLHRGCLANYEKFKIISLFRFAKCKSILEMDQNQLSARPLRHFVWRRGGCGERRGWNSRGWNEILCFPLQYVALFTRLTLHFNICCRSFSKLQSETSTSFLVNPWQISISWCS